MLEVVGESVDEGSVVNERAIGERRVRGGGLGVAGEAAGGKPQATRRRRRCGRMGICRGS